QEDAKHVAMTARLAHQRAANPIIVPFEKGALFENRRVRGIRNAATDDAERFALGVRVDDAENVLGVHGLSRWSQGEAWGQSNDGRKVGSGNLAARTESKSVTARPRRTASG